MIKISEADFLLQVIDLAHIYHWRVAHFRPARTADGWRTAVSGDGVGFPDLVMVRPPRLIFAELKSEKGKTTNEQGAWLEDLRRCRTKARVVGLKSDPGVVADIIEVYLWRPGDFDKILEILKEVEK